MFKLAATSPGAFISASLTMSRMLAFACPLLGTSSSLPGRGGLRPLVKGTKYSHVAFLCWHLEQVGQCRSHLVLEIVHALQLFWRRLGAGSSVHRVACRISEDSVGSYVSQITTLDGSRGSPRTFCKNLSTYDAFGMVGHDYNRLPVDRSKESADASQKK